MRLDDAVRTPVCVSALDKEQGSAPQQYIECARRKQLEDDSTAPVQVEERLRLNLFARIPA